MASTANCLLIKTLDDRQFFTQTENFPLLIEFVKTVGAETAIVKPLSPVTVLDVPDLVRSLCDVTQGTGQVRYEVLEKKIDPNPASLTAFMGTRKTNRREDVINTAKDVRNYARKRLIEGGSLSMSELTERFGEKLSTSSLRSHLAVVRNRLALEGVEVDKVGVGEYKLRSSVNG